MIKHIYIFKNPLFICGLLLLCFNVSSIFAQEIADTIKVSDTIQKKKSKPILGDRVDYSAKDSISFDLTDKNVYLYNESKINFENIELKSGFIKINFENKELSASGINDSSGKLIQTPVFKEGASEYKAKNIDYNFDSKKGFIKGVFTKEGEGYLHGEKIKKVDDKTMFISGGKFTTCDHEHPHFAINFSKAKAVTQDKIVTGPAWLSIMDIPMPLGLPFGYFPFTDKEKSGLLLPTYGYAANRGYYLRNLGWYFPINDYLDVALMGDIYTNLSWAGNVKSKYAKRYKYTGGFDIRFEKNNTGIKNTSTYTEQKDFKFNWTHTQDPKANPYSSFSASVNLVSSTYSQYTTNVSDYFNNTTTSSISYSTKFGRYLNFTASLNESYNVNSGVIDLDLPSASISTIQFFPFRKKKPLGKTKWYEDISVSYRSDLMNKINTNDSLIFKKGMLDGMKNGMKHYIPIESNIKVLKYFNWKNSISYTERWYLQSIKREFTDSLIETKQNGFIANRDISFSSGLNTRVYGFFAFKKGYIKALRHVINPNIDFRFTPDFSNPSLGFYNSYTDTTGKVFYYSKTDNGIFGSPPQGKSGVLNFSLSNNLEMKVKSAKDTVTGTKKIVLLENFSISSGYDLAKDSVRWQPLRLNARTTLFSKLLISFNAAFTPYAMDSLGRLTNELLLNKEGKLFKRQNSQWDFNLNWQFNGKKAEQDSKSSTVSPTEMMYSPFANPNEILGNNVDFSIPWSLSVGLNYSILSDFIAKQAGYETKKTAVFSFTGDVNLTSNWKIGLSSGYDFVNKEFTYTSIDFYRDLHCWEMRMNWIPFGPRMGWNFTIAVKASMLQDLKYEMRNDFRNRVDEY